jgi:site-specific DNA recombinase
LSTYVRSVSTLNLDVAVYARISSDVVGEGLGVARQEADCRALAEGRGWRVVACYIDNDVSAYSGKRRPQYERMLADVEGGHVGGIVAWHPDRLHRSPTELEHFITVVERTRCTVATVQAGELDLTTPSGRMTARIVGAVARGESEHKSARIRRKLQQNAAEGRHHGGERPFGWNNDRVTAREDEAEIVRYAVAEIAGGGALRAIARHLEAAGSRNRDGAPWTETTIRNMIVRPRNVALRSYKGEVVGQGQWEPLVTRESWNAAMRVLTHPSRRSTISREPKHLLSGIARCGVCAAMVRAAGTVDRRGVRRPVYRCPAGHVSRSQNRVDEQIVAVVLARLSMPDAAEVFFHKPSLPDDRDYGAEAEVLRVRLSDAAEDYAEGLLTREQLLAVTSRIRPEVRQLEAQIPRPAPDSRNVLTLAQASDVHAAWDALGLPARRMVVGTLMTVTLQRATRGPVYDPTTVRIVWRQG